jgi:hypothetical protein
MSPSESCEPSESRQVPAGGPCVVGWVVGQRFGWR